MKRTDLFKTASEWMSAIIFLWGLAMLFGWAFDITALKSLSPVLPQIKTNAVICFMLTGLSLWLLQEKRIGSRLGRFIAHLAAFLVFLIASLTFYEYISGVNLGIDQLLFREPVNAVLTSSPNRMALPASINFMLIAVALSLLEAKGEFLSYLAQSLVIMQGLISGMTLLGFIYAANLWYLEPGLSTAISSYAVMLFLLVTFCFLWSRPERGVMKTVTSDGSGGMIMRAIYPTVIFITVLLGWLELCWEKLKMSNENSIALMTLAYIIVISLYLYFLCRKLDMVDVIRKKGGEALRLLAAIVESSDDAIIGKALDGTILSWNKGAERMYGYSSGEIKGRNIAILIPPDRPDELLQMYKRLERGERIEHFETMRCKKDSHCIDVSISVSPIKDDKGIISGFATIARDITYRKKAEEELRRSEAWLSTTIKSIGDGVIATDKDGCVIFLNPVARLLTGWKEDEAKCTPLKTVFNIINEQTGQKVESPVDKVIREGTIVGLANHTILIAKDGRRVPIDDSAAPIKDAKGNFIGVVLIFRDATAKREAEKKLQESMKLKSDFVSLVSHELRTPLTAMKEGLALVVDGTTGPLNDDQKEFLGIAKRNVDRLARLINDVLDLQKLEGGKLSLNLALNDINEVVKEVYKAMGKMVKGKDLTVELKLAEGLPKVMFDRDKIIQVMTNIINNAIKFTDKGKVIISTSKEPNAVAVSIRDTGPGIREGDIPRLFQRFEQLEKGTERKPGGTGLGLAISKEIIEIHGGKIWVESVFGEGTTFFFNLPIIERRGSRV